MGSPKIFNEIIQKIQHSDTREQIDCCCDAFCRYADYDNYLVFGTILTSFLSPPTRILGSLGKSVRNKKQQLQSITQTCMNTSTPVITGNFHPDSPLNNPLIKPLRTSPTKGVSVSFPVHFPAGKFAFLHISTNKARDNNEQQVMGTLASGNLFAREAGNAVLRLLEAELQNKLPYLVPREKECLLLASDGSTPQQIAKQLGLSAHTVIFHLKKAREKLGSKNIQSAISKAILHGDVKTVVDSERR